MSRNRISDDEMRDRQGSHRPQDPPPTRSRPRQQEQMPKPAALEWNRGSLTVSASNRGVRLHTAGDDRQREPSKEVYLSRADVDFLRRCLCYAAGTFDYEEA